MKKPTVAIIGGGVAGLSCAHELRHSDVDVVVYEGGQAVGGKARSHFVAGTGTNGRRDLPGEHGFRFYPSFYLHLTEAMREIPDPLSPTGTVAGNLVSAPEAGVALPGHGVVVSPRRPKSLDDRKRVMRSAKLAGATWRDMTQYVLAHVQYLTSCDARRDDELENVAWANFVGIDDSKKYSESFRRVLLSTTRTMVAMDAENSSARTVGLASSLLMLDTLDTGGDVDRTMAGPTSDCWLDPWQRELEARGVRFQFGHRAKRLEPRAGGAALERAVFQGPTGEDVTVEADVFVLAVPLEAASALSTDALAAASSVFSELRAIDLARTTSWMTGAQFYLSEDLPLVEGHIFFPETPWALTAISQAQFWNRGARHVSGYGDGRLRGILSVDISNCHAPDEDGVRLVDETSREGILRRTLRQLLKALDPPTAAKLERAVFAAHLDDELSVGADGVHNAARLLIHPPGSRFLRPSADSGLGNLFLAGDYLRTEVDLASMEGANEAGRHAAVGVLNHVGRDASHVRFFEHAPLKRFAAMRKIDELAWNLGRPHPFELTRSMFAPKPQRAPAGPV